MTLPPVCMILAGGKGTRLNALAWFRAKPAVPFGGIHRLIDFTVSNSSNSGIHRIGVLTQYLPLSLMEHIGDGSSWDMAARTRVIKILPPQEGAHAKDWYQGTAHAIHQNLDFMTQGAEQEVLILSGDHIYHMDYRAMLEFHRAKKSHFTIATLPVSLEEARRFGIAVTDPDFRIIDFQEKPNVPKNNLGSMGIYIADRQTLIEQLDAIISRGETDIGANLVPGMIHTHRVYAFPFDGYWRDVGTLDSYWEASMDLLDPAVRGLNLGDWNVRTNPVCSELLRRSPVKIGSSARVEKSFVSAGCHIEGSVIRSILSPGVHIARGAEVRDSIIFHDCIIGRSSRIQRVIADKQVHIGENVSIWWDDELADNRDFPDHFKMGLSLLGKHSVIPDEVSMGRHCLVYPEMKESRWHDSRLPSGTVIRDSGVQTD